MLHFQNKTYEELLLYFTENEVEVESTRATSQLGQHPPKLIIIGFSKCGTRALLDFLGLHPNVKVATQEINFFNRFYNNGFNWYLQQMPLSHRETDVTLEKSPEYVHSPSAARRIHNYNRDIKLVVIFCNPVRRAISEWMQNAALHPENHAKDFESDVKLPNGSLKVTYSPIERGRYSLYMRTWLKHFRSDQILTIDGDLFRTNPLPALQETIEYAKLEPFFTERNLYFNKTKGFFCMRTSDNYIKCMGDNKGRSHPSVSDDVTDQMRKFYDPYNRELFRMLDRTFTW